MGQEAKAFERAGIGKIEEWDAVEAPARRRRWFDSHEGTMAVLLASTSDLDDVIPTLVAYQVEWNKLHAAVRSADTTRRRRAGSGRVRRGVRRRGRGLDPDPRGVGRPHARSSTRSARRRLNLRIRMLGGSQAGYARMTRRWWTPVRRAMEEQGLGDRPVYFVSSNPHSMVNLVTATARSGEAEVVRFVEEHGPEYLREELERFRDGRAEGSWENFLYFARAAAVGVAAGGRRGVGAASRGRARDRRHAPLQPRRAAGVRRRSSRSTSSTRRGSTRGSARSTPTGSRSPTR